MIFWRERKYLELLARWAKKRRVPAKIVANKGDAMMQDEGEGFLFLCGVTGYITDEEKGLC